MSNYLKMPKKAQVLALLALGWSYRRIKAETGVRRETISGYDAARQDPNPAKTFPGSDPSPPPDTLDVWRGAGPNPAKTSPTRGQTRPKRSPARHGARGSPRACIAPQSPRSATPV